jgi:ammonium transporter, Amt family
LFMTSLIMVFIKYALRIPLRMSEDELLVGDDAVHGEDAYAFGDQRRSLLYGDTLRLPNNEDNEMGVIHGESDPSSRDGEISAAKGEYKA